MSAQRFVLGAEQRRERVDKVLARLLPEVSRATVQRWIEEGRVQVDGKPCRAKDSVTAGSRIELEAGPRPTSEADPDPSVLLDVCYEDAHLLVVNKPAGLVVHPARGHRTGTLVNGLLARPGFSLPSADPDDEQGSLRPGIVHRIDKDTSGLLVVAKDDRTREGLKTQLAQHSVERAYLALTVGTPVAGYDQESTRARSEIAAALHLAHERGQSRGHARARARALGRRSSGVHRVPARNRPNASNPGCT